MAKPLKHDPQWAKAKELCRLNMDDIRMAKELGLSPKALMKNIPNQSQQWKLPVKLWIRELHQKRFRHRSLPVTSVSPVRGELKPTANDMDVPF